MSAAGFGAGLGYVWRGAALIRRPGLRRYVVGPLLVNIVLLTAALVVIVRTVDHLVTRWLPTGWVWLEYLLWPVLVLGLLVAGFALFSFLANLLGAPFNGALSAAVERELAGPADVEPDDLRTLLRETWRTLRAEVAKLLYFALLAVPCLLLLAVPGVNVAGLALWGVFSAWTLAIEYIDCPLGNHGQPFPDVKRYLRHHRALALGFGTGMAALTAVPLLNFLAMPIGVAGATALYVERLRPDGP